MSLSVARPIVVVPGGDAGAGPRRILITFVAMFDPSPPLGLADGLSSVGVGQLNCDAGRETCRCARRDIGCGPLGGRATAPMWGPASDGSLGPSGLLMLMLCPSLMSTDRTRRRSTNI